jgi:HAD superfamily hydrolase (TIGR01548 family)
MLDTAGTESKRIELVRDQRARLDGLLRELGAETLPSEANFVLVRPDDAAALRRDLASLGIAVRGFSGDAELGPWLRITVPGAPAAWRRLENALRSALRPEALLFDLDGVLADVSGSYRRAITETAARFGVRLTDDDIAGAKAEGNANNDWKLTQRLLAAKGVRRSLDEVTSVFEELYQGQSDAPGLRRHERLMMSAERLRALGRSHRLAVVTGRPRSDALRFLDEHGLRDLFSTVVTMEDGPAKPDPFPVRAALERLGAQQAWMLGDTPDDLRAARAAGVLPVGVVAPGEDVASARSVLEAAGAARVLEHLDELEEMLP